MSAKVILYDIPSKAPQRSWSYNPWKTRLILNLKGIDYETHWLEYPDIEPTLKDLGIPPNDTKEDNTPYSCPAITLKAGKHTEHIMNSANIAPVLESHFPTPSLHLDSPTLPEVFKRLGDIQKHLAADVIPKVPRNLLSTRSAEYFERTRAIRYGMPLSEVEKQKGGEAAWEAAKEPIQAMAALLKKNPEGPFFEGKTRSYADIVLVTVLHFNKRIDEKAFERFVAHDEAFRLLYDEYAEYFKKDT